MIWIKDAKNQDDSFALYGGLRERATRRDWEAASSSSYGAVEQMELVLNYRRGSFQLTEKFETLLNAIERANYLWVRREGELFEIRQEGERLIGDSEIRAAWIARNLGSDRENKPLHRSES